MPGIDWEAKVGAPCVAVFAENDQGVIILPLYTPLDDTIAPYNVSGVFDNQFRATSIADADSPHVTDSLPVFGVNAAQFVGAPAAGDLITWPAGTKPYSGKTYIVIEPRPDSHGIYHLALQEHA